MAGFLVHMDDRDGSAFFDVLEKSPSIDLHSISTRAFNCGESSSALSKAALASLILPSKSRK